MYLEAARQFGDFLIVGLDSDEKIRRRKGENRPVVPQMERLRMVTHQRGVGLVTLKHTHHPKWALIKAVRPDVLVATEETYTQAEITELEAELLRPGQGARADGDGEHVGAAAGHHHGQPGHLRRRGQRGHAAQQAGVGHPATELTDHGADRPVKQVLLYLPVVHAGHEAFFARHPDAAEILLLGPGFKSQFKSLAKDIRALPPDRAAQFLRLMLPARHGPRGRARGPAAALTADTLVLPDEDVTRQLAEELKLGPGTGPGLRQDLPALGPGVEPGAAARGARRRGQAGRPAGAAPAPGQGAGGP